MSARAVRWTRCRGRSRCSQRSPNARACRLPPSGTATTTTPPGASRRAAWRIASPGAGRCSSECQNTTAAHSPSISSIGSWRRSSRAAARSSPVAARPRRASASISVPSPAPTSRTGPGGAIASSRAGQAPARAAQQLVAEDAEPPARLRPVPRAVGAAQLLVGRPGVDRRRAARRAADPPAADGPRSARAAPRTRRTHASRSGDEQTATRSSAASRPSSRRWKSSGAIAAARGSSACR